MLWLVIKGASHQIVACNIHKENGKYQVWVEKTSGKTIKIKESTNQAEVNEIKSAIDYAIKNGHPSLELA